jgi:O-antigen ligase
VNGRLTAFLFLATLFCLSFEKIQWELAGTIGLSGILAAFFVLSFGADHATHATRPRVHNAPKTVAVLLLFGLLFLLVYLGGFFNIETEQAAGQFAKGLARFAITFAFAAAGIAYLARRPLGFYWIALGVLCAGVAFNAVYGIAQLAFAESGRNLDQTVLGPLLGDARPINFYGAVEGADVYRPNALTNDPNHLGIVLLLPLLILTPLYLRLERGHRLKLLLAVLLPLLLLVELATLSRSGLLGLAVGTLILLVPYRRRFLSAAVLAPLGGLALVLAWVVSRRVEFFETVVRSRLDTQADSTAVHFDVYELIGPALDGHALFGLGLNTFSVYYEAVTGLTNWGPHSFYAALVIETGVVGAALFALFLFWVFRRLRAGHRLGRALASMRDPLAARVRPLAWGLTAAIVGVMAANAFYLTMQQSYFYALTMLALALPVVFGRRLAPPT